MKIKLTDKEEAFFNEYVALCKKHGMMVFSEGERVEIGEVHDPKSLEDPWEVRWHTLVTRAQKEGKLAEFLADDVGL